MFISGATLVTVPLKVTFDPAPENGAPEALAKHNAPSAVPAVYPYSLKITAPDTVPMEVRDILKLVCSRSLAGKTLE
jgi:hypothetical protein